jgi:hypothetical protein
LSFLLLSCGGGGAAAISGAGQIAVIVDDIQDATDIEVPIGPICGGNVSGDWRGKTSNGGVILLTLRQNHACEIQGEAAFPPCLSVSPVTGMVLLFGQNFTVETSDGSLFVKRSVDLDAENKSFTEKGSYRFNNTQKVADCPQSETGSVKFTKTG